MSDGPELAPGTELDGRYRLESVLGRGGMGQVWRAVDIRLRRPVAVKVLPPEFADVPGVVDRFAREAEATAALQHPGITVVFDVGRAADGLAYLVMELLEGEDLWTVLRRHPDGLPVEEAVDYAVQLADALAAAHSRGIVHRDIKPANLFVLAGGRLKLCDFGIAGLADAATRLTHDGGSVGTPLYMAPEQFHGGAADSRSDLYALGCVLHELLTGAPPFRPGSGLPRIMYAHLNEPPPPIGGLRPDVPPRLERLVLDLLTKEVDERPASAEAVASLLRTVEGAAAVPPPFPPVAPLPPAAPPPPVGPTSPVPVREPARRTSSGGTLVRVLLAVGAALVVGVVLVGVAAFVVVDDFLDRGASTRGERDGAVPSQQPATSRSTSASPTPPTVHKVTYKVTGSVPEATLQIFHPEGGMSTQTAELPWSDTYEVESLTVLGVGGNTGTRSGTINCSISVDGEEVQKRSSEGQFAVVSCQYQAPIP